MAFSIAIHCFKSNPRKIVSEFVFGEAGRRSLYLSHAKRALYHLSYIPVDFTVDFRLHTRFVTLK